jgi:hypothetical protein
MVWVVLNIRASLAEVAGAGSLLLELANCLLTGFPNGEPSTGMTEAIDKRTDDTNSDDIGSIE